MILECRRIIEAKQRHISRSVDVGPDDFPFFPFLPGTSSSDNSNYHLDVLSSSFLGVHHPFLLGIMQRFQAETLFQPSNLVAAIEEANQVGLDGNRKPLFGSILSFPHHQVARTVAVLGLDLVMIDALHTLSLPHQRCTGCG